MNKFYRKAVLLQIFVDYLSIITAFILGYLLWDTLRPDINFHLPIYLRFSAMFGIVYLFIFWLVKLYEEELSILNVEQLRRIIKGWIIGGGLLFSIGFLSKELSFSRLTFVFSFILLLIILIVQRLFFFRLFQKLHKKGIGVRKAVIVGTDDAAVNIFNILLHSPWLGIVPVGFVDDEKLEVIGKDNKLYSVLTKIDLMETIVDLYNIEQVIISYSELAREQIEKVLKISLRHKLHVRMIPHFYNASIQRIQVENLLGMPLLSINTPKTNWFYRNIKRILDIILSAAILVCLFPVFAILSLLVKKDSQGPVLFSQDRVGRNGRLFKIYKFRSMYTDANTYEVCPRSSDDSRITRIGRFLRKTSLDELPQFINVLKGDMSIVGPRPEMPFIVENYNDMQRQRLKIRPGITGLWQISHQRGSPIHENIDYDLYYIENQSITMDLAIILNTIFSIVRGLGAC